MLPEIIFYSGIAICCITAIGAIIALIVLRFYKIRLNEKLDSEYGKQRY